MSEPYVLVVDLLTRCVRPPAGDPPRNLAKFQLAKVPAPDTTTYNVEFDSVTLSTHWLATSPLYLLRDASKLLAAHSLADFAALTLLTTSPNRIAKLVRNKKNDGPEDPLFASVVVAHPGDVAHVRLPSGDVRIESLPEERTREMESLPEAGIEDALCSGLLDMLQGQTNVGFALAAILQEPDHRIDYGLRMRREITRGAMARWRSHHIANGRAHGLRIVMPYLSESVARFLWNDPSAFFQDGWNKAPLRRLLHKYVSEEVAWRRSSQGLRWPIAPFFRQNRWSMSRRLASSGLRTVSPLYWSAGALVGLPASWLGRLYSAALAHDAATLAYLGNREGEA